MYKIYKSVGEEIIGLDTACEKGIWLNIVQPSEEEIQAISTSVGASIDLLRYPLDEEETSRIEYENDQMLIIVKIPVIRGITYDTVPLGIILKEDAIITICLEGNSILDDFAILRPKTFYTFKKTRFLLQILYRTATQYLKYLRQIDKKTDEVERLLHGSMRNEEVIRLLNLQKSLVYFTTSLKSNQIVLEKLLRSKLGKDALGKDALDKDVSSRILRMYEEDEDLLEDVITENKQAIEMGDIYTRILSGTMDAFASIISNNLNIVMKFLTSVTIVLAIPTIIASIYGMNVSLPFQDMPYAFILTISTMLILMLLTVIFFVRRKMF